MIREWLDDAVRLLGRLVVLAIVSVLAFGVSGIVLQPLFPQGVPPGAPGAALLAGMTCFGLLAGTTAVSLLFERGSWSVAGLDIPRWQLLDHLFVLGLGWVVVLLPAGIMLLTGALTLEPTTPGSWWRAAGQTSLLLLLPALVEELLARGYAFGALERTWGPLAAIMLTSLCFGALHLGNPGVTPWSIGGVVIAGVFLGAVRFTTGSVIAAWLAHLAINVAQGVFMHAPISGLAFAVTPGYRTVPSGPEWLTGGEWGLEAGAGTAATLLVVTFLLLYLHRVRSHRPRAR